MKIIPFDPQPAIKPAKTSRSTGTQTLDFERELAKSAPPNSSVRAVTAENFKASLGVSQEDLGTAGQLLHSLIGQIKTLDPQELQKVHKLDGILYYYQL
jgi:hypothetical protein